MPISNVWKRAATAWFATGVIWSAAHAQVIKPTGDITTIKTAAGEISMLHTIRRNNTAHEVETLTFFIRSSSGPAELIPFDFDPRLETALVMRSGADCMVSSARVIRDGPRLHVVYAQRKGEWFDQQPVTFQRFELTVNEAEAPGMAPLYFGLKKTAVTKTKYCDVNDALDKEAALYRPSAR